MNNADDLYSVVTGSHLSDPGKCSEISAFLLQLLSKDYNSISSTYVCFNIFSLFRPLGQVT